MQNIRLIGIGLVIIGAVLLIFGINATHKIGEKVIENVTGKYSDATMWYIIGGVVLIVGGLGLAFKKRQ